MKNKKAFEKWKNDFGMACDDMYLAWEACEAHYESRTCEGCKHYDKDCQKCDLSTEIIMPNAKYCLVEYPPSFACKYWEAK